MSDENKTPDIDDGIAQDISNGFSDENSTLFAEKSTDDKPVKKKNKILLRIVVPVLILALLAGGVFALIKLVPENDPIPETTSVPSLNVTLLSMALDEIASVKVTNTAGSYILFPTMGKIANSSGEETDGTVWSIKEMDAQYTNKQTIESAVSSFANITALRLMEENAQDLAQYGLEKPTATLEIMAHDTEKNFKMFIGNTAPTEDGKYARVDGSNDVYLINSGLAEECERENTHYISVAILGAVKKDSTNQNYFDNEDALVSFDEIEISGTKNPSPITLKMNPYKGISSIPYVMTTPVQQSVMGEAGDAAMAPMKSGLMGDGAYAYMPDNAALARYSLDNPYTVVKYTIAEQKVTLKVGIDPDDSEYYAVMVDDKPIIYKIVKQQLPFVAYNTEQYFNNYIFLDDITSIKSVTAITENGTHTYELTHSMDEKDLAAIEVRADGNTLNDQNFRYLYQYMISCTAMEFTMDSAPSDIAPSLTLKVEYLDDTRSLLTINYVKTADRRYHVTVNGVPLGHAYQTTVDNLISWENGYFAGEEVPKP